MTKQEIEAYKLNPIAQQKKWDLEKEEKDRWNMHGTLKSDCTISREMEFDGLDCDTSYVKSDNTY